MNCLAAAAEIAHLRANFHDFMRIQKIPLVGVLTFLSHQVSVIQWKRVGNVTEWLCAVRRRVKSNKTIGVSNSLHPDQARRFVGRDLHQNVLHRLQCTGRDYQTQYLDLKMSSFVAYLLHFDFLCISS